MPESPNLSAGIKLLPMHSRLSMPAMNEKEALSERMEPTSGHSSRYPESYCRSANEKLLADACRLVLEHANRHYMGNRLSQQSAHDIRRDMALLLSSYEIRPRP